MLRVPELKVEVLDTHVSVQLERFYVRREEALKCSAADRRSLPWLPDLMNYLDYRVAVILAGKPPELRKIIREVKREFPAFHRYCLDNPTVNSPLYVPALNRLLIRVRKLFDYDSFARKSGDWNAYKLVQAHGLRLCPYCQLAHVNFHLEDGGKRFSMRPPLDHFYPRARYPLLAVSAFNLIPSCWQCNSSVKSENDPLSRKLPHPIEADANISFRLEKYSRFTEIKNPDGIEVCVEGESRDWQSFVSFFRLSDRYKWYSCEIFDLYRRHARYMDFDTAIRGVISKDDFVLEFPRTQKNSRLLGICLSQLLDKF